MQCKKKQTFEGYVLNFFTQINLVSFKLQRQQCSTAGYDFLFKEIPVQEFYTYEHNDSGMYLTCSCDRKARLTLIRSSNRHKDRKIRFVRSTRI